MNLSIRIIFSSLVMITQALIAQEYVAILEFEGSGMNTSDARNITQTFSYELSQTDKFTIIERQDLDQIINELKMQLSGCVADECAVEVGKLAGARYVIAGTVTKTIGLYGIAVRLIDVETGEIKTQILENGEEDQKVFQTQIVRNAALKMAAEGGASTQSGSSTGTVNNDEKGTVNFDLNKANAAIYVDGVYTTIANGTSVSLKLTARSHTIKFVLSGYKDHEQKVNVLANKSLSYNVGFKSGVSSSGGTAAPSEFGIVVVRSDPGSGTVYLDGVGLGMTPAQNTKIGIGKHRVRVEKLLYHPYVEEITITSDGIVEVMADLKPAYGHLLLNSEPTGAVVQLNGQQKGRTPLDLPELASGDYRIMLSKDLYHIAEEQYTVTDNSDNVHTITLHPAFGKLSIKVNPKGADVFIDGQLKGKAPVLLNELPSGPYRLKVAEELYGTFEEQIIIEDGKTTEKSIALSSRFGTLNITGSPKGANISIDGKTVGAIPLKKHKVGTGLIKVEIEAKDHHKYSKSFPVDMNGNYPLKVDLVQYSGRVIAITEPPDAKIYLDGKYRGLSPQILTHVPIGQHILVFKHSDFLEEVREFNLGLDKRKEFNVKLVTYAGSIEHKISKKRWRRNLSLLASAGFAYWAVNMKNQSDQAYDSYKTGTESDEVTSFYNEANSLNQQSLALWGVAATALIPAIYAQVSIKESKLKLKVGQPNRVFVNPESRRFDQNTNSLQQVSEMHTLTDIDGNTYKTVKIGDQIWMAENLRVTHYRNGRRIAHLIDNRDWTKTAKGAYCAYGNDEKNGNIYGKLYNWYAISDKRNIAPQGWHVPTDEEWQTLIDYLGVISEVTSQLINMRAVPGVNQVKQEIYGVGLTAQLGGYRFESGGNYTQRGFGGYYWSSTSNGSDDAWIRAVYSENAKIRRYYDNKGYGFSVRCVKD